MRRTAFLACVLLAAGVPLAHAASDSTKADGAAATKQGAASMSAEEKAAARKDVRSRGESMTPEQKAEARKRRAEKKRETTKASTASKDKPVNKPAADLPPPSIGPS